MLYLLQCIAHSLALAMSHGNTDFIHDAQRTINKGNEA